MVESAHTPADTPGKPVGGFGSLKNFLKAIFDDCGDDEVRLQLSTQIPSLTSTYTGGHHHKKQDRRPPRARTRDGNPIRDASR